MAWVQGSNGKWYQGEVKDGRIWTKGGNTGVAAAGSGGKKKVLAPWASEADKAYAAARPDQYGVPTPSVGVGVTPTVGSRATQVAQHSGAGANKYSGGLPNLNVTTPEGLGVSAPGTPIATSARFDTERVPRATAAGNIALAVSGAGEVARRFSQSPAAQAITQFGQVANPLLASAGPIGQAIRQGSTQRAAQSAAFQMFGTPFTEASDMARRNAIRQQASGLAAPEQNPFAPRRLGTEAFKASGLTAQERFAAQQEHQGGFIAPGLPGLAPYVVSGGLLEAYYNAGLLTRPTSGGTPTGIVSIGRGRGRAIGGSGGGGGLVNWRVGV